MNCRVEIPACAGMTVVRWDDKKERFIEIVESEIVAPASLGAMTTQEPAAGMTKRGSGYFQMGCFEMRETDEGVVFTVKVVPGSSQTAIAGTLGAMLKVRVSAAPEKGKANKCLRAFLAEKLGVKKQAVTIISGSTNPVKQLQIAGVNTDDIVAALQINGHDRI